MESQASAKYLRGSAQKARLVVDMIRGKNVSEALAILTFTNKRAAQGIEKCVRSAVANATEAAEKANVAVDPDDLWIKACFVDMGPTKNRRRVRPAPQGRAYREQRHFHHVTILLSNDERPSKGVEVPDGRKASSKAGKPKTSGEGKKPAGGRTGSAGPTGGSGSGSSGSGGSTGGGRGPKKIERPPDEHETAKASADEGATGGTGGEGGEQSPGGGQ